jgi:hypothetical protein
MSKEFEYIRSKVIGKKVHIWNVERIWKLAEELPKKMIDVESITELDVDCWFSPYDIPSVRNVARHAKRIYNADMSMPIILDYDGSVIDGFHRLAKALLNGDEQIKAVQFNKEIPADIIKDIEAKHNLEFA